MGKFELEIGHIFEKILRELKQLKLNQKFSIPVEVDKDGYTDRECPDEKCLFQFKVNSEDWKNLFHEDKVLCPMCRHEANAQSWWTSQQLQHGRQQVKQQIVSRINSALCADARTFNAGQVNNSFIRMSMRFMSSTAPAYILPIPSKEEMEQKIQCKVCNARYAVVGSGFFCPCCGHNSVEETFDNSIRKIEAKIKNIPLIKEAIEMVSKDDAELTCRSLIETALNDCVVAFQRFNEVSFTRIAPAVRARFNAFQNIDSGNQYWRMQIGEGFSDWITHRELFIIKTPFQKRHLLSHTEGIVDQKYLENSSDSSYQIGQRIVVKEDDVRECVRIILKIIDNLKSRLSSANL